MKAALERHGLFERRRSAIGVNVDNLSEHHLVPMVKKRSPAASTADHSGVATRRIKVTLVGKGHHGRKTAQAPLG